jgi:hypothetical protein
MAQFPFKSVEGAVRRHNAGTMLMAAGQLYSMMDILVLAGCLMRGGALTVVLPLLGFVADGVVIAVGMRARNAAAHVPLIGVGPTLLRPVAGLIAHAVVWAWNEDVGILGLLWVFPFGFAGLVMSGFALVWTRKSDEAIEPF